MYSFATSTSLTIDPNWTSYDFFPYQVKLVEILNLAAWLTCLNPFIGTCGLLARVFINDAPLFQEWIRSNYRKWMQWSLIQLGSTDIFVHGLYQQVVPYLDGNKPFLLYIDREPVLIHHLQILLHLPHWSRYILTFFIINISSWRSWWPNG